jgi:hypothetical protein
MPGGRPRKVTPELVDELCSLLRVGVLIEPACAKVGIDDSSFRKWRQADREFFTAVTRARAEGEIALWERALGGDEKGESNGPAKCAQWALERSYSARYAPRLNVQIREVSEALLDDIERVCASKDCGCFEELIDAVARRASGEAPSEDPGDAPEVRH